MATQFRNAANVVKKIINRRFFKNLLKLTREAIFNTIVYRITLISTKRLRFYVKTAAVSTLEFLFLNALRNLSLKIVL